MSELELLERKIQKLPARERARFRAWFAEFDWEEWDRQLERDIKAGKLDSLARKARKDHAEGRTKRGVSLRSAQQRTWMKGFGGLADLKDENARIVKLIEDEFERVEPEDRR